MAMGLVGLLVLALTGFDDPDTGEPTLVGRLGQAVFFVSVACFVVFVITLIVGAALWLKNWHQVGTDNRAPGTPQ